MSSLLDLDRAPLHDAHVFMWLGADLLIEHKICPTPAPCPYHDYERFRMVFSKKMDINKGAKRPYLWYVWCGCGAQGPFALSQSEALEKWAIPTRKMGVK
jgi:hypothetical protein